MEPAFSGPEKWQALVLSPSQGLQRKLNKKSQKDFLVGSFNPFSLHSHGGHHPKYV